MSDRKAAERIERMKEEETDIGSDAAFIRRMDAIDRHDMVALLKDGNDDAWRYVLLRVVVPVLHRPMIAKIKADRRLSDLDVLGMLFEQLIQKRDIDNYAYKCPVVYWMRPYVFKVVMEYCKKNDAPVSDENYLNVLKDENAPMPNSDLFEEARVCFNRLWKEDKLKARVHYLKTVSEMSSRDIMRLLNISSEANVNQLFSRACRLMRMYREELRQVPTGNEKEVLYALS